MRAFSLAERGLAWAIKYANDVVIAVAYSGWSPSNMLSAFAEKRQVKILTVPLDALPAEMSRRLQHMHYVSTALKEYPESEKIIRRFVD